MTLTPRDRRGLNEVVSYASMTVACAGVLIAQILTGHAPDHMLMAALVGLLLLVSGRGVQSATERSGSSELRNLESAELRASRERMDATTKRLEDLTMRILDAHVESTLPGLPPTKEQQ